MIFVTIGTPSQGFPRLIKKMDEIAGKIDEKIIMQIGYEKYKPKNAEYFDFLEDFEKIIELNKLARIVVCHGGIGGIITALQQGTPVIAVPRLKKYNEENDDHQLETVEALKKEWMIKVVYEVEELDQFINNPDINKIKIKANKDLTNFLRDYINNRC